MSILNRPGWANRTIVNEGRLHSDELKHRITNLFRRTSLGNSPTYAVGKIADILRREKGDDIDINDIADEDIIRIANDEEVTNGKFQPELKGGIADARQESEDQMSGLDSGLPSDQDVDDQNEVDDTNPNNDDDQLSSDDMGDIGINIKDEEAEEPNNHQEEQEEEQDEEQEEHEYHSHNCSRCESQRPRNEIPVNKVIRKENTKLSSKAVNELLKENYIKSRQHRFIVEERYGKF